MWTWGHCGVSPRRVQLAGARDVQRTSGEEVHRAQSHYTELNLQLLICRRSFLVLLGFPRGVYIYWICMGILPLLLCKPDTTHQAGSESSFSAQVVFHKGQTAVARPLAVRIAAGAAHSSCLTQVSMSFQHMRLTDQLWETWQACQVAGQHDCAQCDIVTATGWTHEGLTPMSLCPTPGILFSSIRLFEHVSFAHALQLSAIRASAHVTVPERLEDVADPDAGCGALTPLNIASTGRRGAGVAVGGPAAAGAGGVGRPGRPHRRRHLSRSAAMPCSPCHALRLQKQRATRNHST